MQRQTFILTQKKTFRHNVKLYLKSNDKKVDQRQVKFTTEHKVSEKARNTNARNVAAEFSTSDPILIDALYRDTGYGKTFVHKDDPKGERKKEPFNITPVDSKRLALKNLFNAVGLQFDDTKSIEVLQEEYNFHVAAKTGVVIEKSTATEIKHEQIDVQKNIQEQAEAARALYSAKYGESIPDAFANDLGFLSALSNPDFDAKAYIEKNTETSGGEEEGDELPDDAESLGKIYFQVFGKNVANPKKNDIGWIKDQIKNANQ